MKTCLKLTQITLKLIFLVTSTSTYICGRMVIMFPKNSLFSCHSVPYDVKNYVDTSNVETYILGDFNINLWQNGHYVFQKHNLLSCHSVPNDVKNYFDFCTMFGLKQLIESPTRITCSIPFIMDHILESFLDRVTQQGILNFALSDHQLIYYTRKITRKKEVIISK